MSKNRNFDYECMTTQFVDVSSISCECTELAKGVSKSGLKIGKFYVVIPDIANSFDRFIATERRAYV